MVPFAIKYSLCIIFIAYPTIFLTLPDPFWHYAALIHIGWESLTKQIGVSI